FQFIRNVLNNESGFEPGNSIEDLRKQLLQDPSLLEVKDYGAGSRIGGRQQKRIKDIAASALKPDKLAHVLYRLAAYYKPSSIIELGTSLGLTTAYFSRAVPGANIITIEGSPAIAAKAKDHFSILGCRNITGLTGSFDEVLPGILDKISSVDLAYIDGNHRYAPTVQYFQQFLAWSNEHSILVFDDIHWSAEMEQAWEEIKNHPAVKYTIDVFYLGFVFFRNDFRVRQDFRIRLP
ncbi:MAG: O-methyltransferase, partial [Flavisolibacter sp.]